MGSVSGLPAIYRWLGEIVPLPRMLAEAIGLIGTAETPGPADTKRILEWAAEIGGEVASAYRADAIAWCGLFMAVVAKRAGKPVPDRPLWALNWRGFGLPSPCPSLGDVMVFRRGGGGHVGLYVGEDETAFHILGGNQRDQVGFARIARSRLAAARRPAYRVAPHCVAPVQLSAKGGVSRNEG